MFIGPRTYVHWKVTLKNRHTSQIIKKLKSNDKSTYVKVFLDPIQNLCDLLPRAAIRNIIACPASLRCHKKYYRVSRDTKKYWNAWSLSISGCILPIYGAYWKSRYFWKEVIEIRCFCLNRLDSRAAYIWKPSNQEPHFLGLRSCLIVGPYFPWCFCQLRIQTTFQKQSFSILQKAKNSMQSIH